MTFSKPVLIFTIYLVVGAIVALYIFVSITHIARARSRRREDQIMERLWPLVERAVNSGRDKDISKLASRVRRSQLKYVEEMLMDVLAAKKSKRTKNAIKVARSFGFPMKALKLFNSRSIINVALACRKSGLYRNAAAAPSILKALRAVSSTVQFQAVTALAQIGEISYFLQAFEDIQQYIMLNERTLFEIIKTYEGDMRSMYETMIAHTTDYLATIFLKSMDADMARGLSHEVVSQLGSENMERLIAAVKAVSYVDDPLVVEKLKGFLGDKRWQVRAAVVKALGGYTNYDLAPYLVAALSDENWWVRTNAAKSLLRFDDIGPYVDEVVRGGDKFAKDCLSHAIKSKNDAALMARLAAAEGRVLSA